MTCSSRSSPTRRPSARPRARRLTRCRCWSRTGAAGASPLADEPGTEPQDEQENRRRLRSVFGPLPATGVLGLDDQRRGKPRYRRGDEGGWEPEADRWQTMVTDSAGGHGLLGVVETRTKAPVIAWIRAQPAAWRDGIWAVTIDMSTSYRAVAREALPHAIVAADHFHVARHMGTMCDDVRRRISQQLHGRRGRATDIEYQLTNALRYGPGRLSDRGRRKILDGLGELVMIDGDGAYDLRVSWTAKNLLLRVLALSPSRTGRPITRTEIAHALFRFFDHVATFGTGIPELVTATETIDNWLEEITNAV